MSTDSVTLAVPPLLSPLTVKPTCPSGIVTPLAMPVGVVRAVRPLSDNPLSTARLKV